MLLNINKAHPVFKLLTFDWTFWRLGDTNVIVFRLVLFPRTYVKIGGRNLIFGYFYT